MSRRRSAEQRLQRLLVMLPWLMERETVPIAEVAQRFGLSEAEVTEDLELAAMCGLPPYADELIDVYVDEGVVHMGIPRVFTRPLQLTAVEAFELLIAVRAALRLPGVDRTGALARGFEKIAAVLGQPGIDDEGVSIEIEQTPIVEDLVDAARRIEIVVIEYWSPAADGTRERRVLPRQVFADRGHWYLTGVDCDLAAMRTFRTDRIVSHTRTGEFVDPPDDDLPTPGQWFSSADLQRATIRVPERLMWLIERYPVDEVTTLAEPGWVEVVLPVTSEHWLARLMVRLGPSAQVVAPESWRDVGRAAAAAILARYQTT